MEPPSEQERAASGMPRWRLAPAAKTLWRVTAALWLLPALLLAGWAASGLAAAGAAGAIRWLPFVLTLVAVAAGAMVVPELRYRRWRYEIREDEIDIRHGALSIRRTLVPMSRVQHVETRSGPLQSMFGLATVIFHTAAGENVIPQLREQEADEVRRRVASLARASSDDV